jgi:hypothetical protein
MLFNKGFYMKKIITCLLVTLSCGAFAVGSDASVPALDTSKLECHCEKHKMIFELKDGESLSEMSKHCTMNIDKNNSMVKFMDDRSEQTVKCSVKNDKLEINTCKPFKHSNKSEYKRSTMMSESEYTNVSSH